MRRGRSVVWYVRGGYDIGYLEECRGSTQTIPSGRRAEVRYDHAVTYLTFFGQYDQVCEVAIRSKGANLLDGVGFARVIEQLGDEPHEVRYEVEQFRRWTWTCSKQYLRTDRVRKVSSEFILCLVGHDLLIVLLHRRQFHLTRIVQRPRRCTLRHRIFPEGHGLLLTLDPRLALRGLLLEQVLAVHFGPLQLILDVTGVVRRWTFHTCRIPGLLALEAGMAAFWFGWGHDSRFVGRWFNERRRSDIM